MSDFNTIRDHAANQPAASLDLKNRYWLDADTGAVAMCVEKDHGQGLVYEWVPSTSYDPNDETWSRRLGAIDDRASARMTPATPTV